MADLDQGMARDWSNRARHPDEPVQRTEMHVTINTQQAPASAAAAEQLLRQLKAYVDTRLLTEEGAIHHVSIPAQERSRAEDDTHLVHVRVLSRTVEIGRKRGREEETGGRVHAHYNIVLIHTGRVDLRKSVIRLRAFVRRTSPWKRAMVNVRLIRSKEWNYYHKQVKAGQYTNVMMAREEKRLARVRRLNQWLRERNYPLISYT